MSNILPYHHKKEIHEIRVLRLVTVTFWALILLLITAGILLIPQLVMVDTNYTIATGQIAQLEKTKAVVNPIDITSLDQEVTTLSNKLDAPVVPSPTSYIATVRAVTAPGISLTGFSMEENNKTPTLQVSGTSTSREALQRFVSTLEQMQGVTSVDSPVSNYVKSGTNSFQINVVFK